MITDALALLADVFDAPAYGAPVLDEVRALWPSLDADEKAALTPLAQLAAARVKAAASAGDEPARSREPPPRAEDGATSTPLGSGGGTSAPLAWTESAALRGLLRRGATAPPP